MGLDMNLFGEKHNHYSCEETEDGFKVSSVKLELAYWRKHPNLHGYIVKTFADGEDNCQQIELGIDELKKIIEAIQNDELSKTQGFFFGASPDIKENPIEYQEQKQEDIAAFTAALEWMSGSVPSQDWRSVYYQASW